MLLRAKFVLFSISNWNWKDKLPLIAGKVGGKSAEVLRDTGCIGVIIKRDLVSQDQFCETYGYAMTFDQTVVRALIAKIRVDTPHYVRKVKVLCFRKPIYELIIGNIPGAKESGDSADLGTCCSYKGSEYTNSRNEHG